MKATAVSSTSSLPYLQRLTAADAIDDTGNANSYFFRSGVTGTSGVISVELAFTRKQWKAGRVRPTDAASSRVPQQESIKRKFEALAHEWIDETQFSSDLNASFLHPAYQRIIGMGNVALPLILRALEENPAYWFWAIDSIVGKKILPDDFSGGFADAVEFYLSWGKKHLA